MSLGILLSDGTPDWNALERAARETCRDLSFDRAMNIARLIPQLVRYARELEADRRRIQHVLGPDLTTWRDIIDLQMAGSSAPQ